MTDYDEGLDLTTAARRYLAADPGLRATLGSDQAFSTWVFRWRPYAKVEGSGAAAVVLAERGGFMAPNLHNRMAFPRLQVEVWADAPRDAAGNPTARTAEDLAFDVHRELDRLLHITDGQLHEWGSDDGVIRILRSTRLDEPDPVEVPGGDTGLIRSTVNYGVVLG